LKLNKRKNRLQPASIFEYGTIILYALFCIVPFVLITIVSFTPQEVISEQGFTFFPSKVTLDAYKYIFRFPETILKAYGVSMFVAVVGTALNLMITILVAYPLSRAKFRYRRLTVWNWNTRVRI